MSLFKQLRAFAISGAVLVALIAVTAHTVANVDTQPVVWLCRPGIANDPCTAPRTATVIVGGRMVGVQTAETDARATRFDCFYTAAYGDVAYASVLAAWRDYQSKYNHGRPVVFIGHSQGTQMISRLLRQEIEPSPTLRKQVLLAILVGGNIAVADAPGGQGSFSQIPACRAAGQIGCVIGYSIYSAPPPADSRFGIPGQAASFQGKQFARAGVHIICTNPSNTAGSSAPRAVA
jgi:pimeloyl-ACP methyl ester carboxylesterase